jgi:acetylornithine deacetylase/succinyl-diaminopimelate desuccinylase-like protein
MRVIRFVVAAAFLCAAATPCIAAPGDLGKRVDGWVARNQRGIVTELAQLVAIPNVKSDRAAMQRNAEFLRDMLARRGFKVEIIPTDGSPVVIGERDVKGAKRTLLLYAHYDGQAVDPSRWKQASPFTPVMRDGRLEDGAKEIPDFEARTTFDPEWRLYARSSSDDKGPIVALCAALDALDASKVAPTSRLRIVLDGEEESESASLIAALPGLRERLRADLMLCFDGPGHPVGRPTVVYGVRGIMTMNLTVYGPKNELHSGHYGNWVPNPAMRLARLLASMKDDDGRVLVKGFYDGIAPLTPAEEVMLRAVPDDTTGLMKRFGIAAPERPGLTLQQALQLPTLNIRGLASADVGAAARTVIPATATASIDVRLVQETPAAAMVDKLRAHIREQGFFVVDADPDDATRASHRDIVSVTASHGTEAYRTDPAAPLSKQVADAVGRIHGQPPVLLRTMGGTLPIAPIAKLLEVPVIVVPTVNFDNNQHSDNENLRLGHLFESVKTLAALLTM